MTSVGIEKPPGAPYIVTAGEPVEVRVFEEGGLIVGEVEYRGDKIGATIDPEELDVPEAVAVDEMVTNLGRYIWHELGGTPVFPEDGERWTARVEVQAPWLLERRTPTLGLIANPEAVVVPEPEPEEPIGTAMNDAREGEEVEVALGVDPSETIGVHFTEDELDALTRGRMPESVMRRMVRAMPSPRLLVVIRDYLDDADSDVAEHPARDQAVRALDELERRIGD